MSRRESRAKGRNPRFRRAEENRNLGQRSEYARCKGCGHLRLRWQAHGNHAPAPPWPKTPFGRICPVCALNNGQYTGFDIVDGEAVRRFKNTPKQVTSSNVCPACGKRGTKIGNMTGPHLLTCLICNTDYNPPKVHKRCKGCSNRYHDTRSAHCRCGAWWDTGLNRCCSRVPIHWDPEDPQKPILRDVVFRKRFVRTGMVVHLPARMWNFTNNKVLGHLDYRIGDIRTERTNQNWQPEPLVDLIPLNVNVPPATVPLDFVVSICQPWLPRELRQPLSVKDRAKWEEMKKQFGVRSFVSLTSSAENDPPCPVNSNVQHPSAR